jgi:hypothetical protein
MRKEKMREASRALTLSFPGLVRTKNAGKSSTSPAHATHRLLCGTSARRGAFRLSSPRPSGLSDPRRLLENDAITIEISERGA